MIPYLSTPTFFFDLTKVFSRSTRWAGFNKTGSSAKRNKLFSLWFKSWERDRKSLFPYGVGSGGRAL